MRTVGKLVRIIGATLIVVAMARHNETRELPESYAQASLCGPISAISDEALVVHGVKVRLDADTLLKGVNDQDRVVNLKSSDLTVGCIVTVLMEEFGSPPLALAVFRGDAFLIRGTVSGIKTGRDGYVMTVTLDHRIPVDVRDADVGQDSNKGPITDWQPTEGEVNLGDVITLQGIAVAGEFHAVFVRVNDGVDRDEGEPEQTPIEVSRHSSNQNSFPGEPRISDRQGKSRRELVHLEMP